MNTGRNYSEAWLEGSPGPGDPWPRLAASNSFTCCGILHILHAAFSSVSSAQAARLVLSYHLIFLQGVDEVARLGTPRSQCGYSGRREGCGSGQTSDPFPFPTGNCQLISSLSVLSPPPGAQEAQSICLLRSAIL